MKSKIIRKMLETIIAVAAISSVSVSAMAAPGDYNLNEFEIISEEDKENLENELLDEEYEKLSEDDKNAIDKELQELENDQLLDEEYEKLSEDDKNAIEKELQELENKLLYEENELLDKEYEQLLEDGKSKETTYNFLDRKNVEKMKKEVEKCIDYPKQLEKNIAELQKKIDENWEKIEKFQKEQAQKEQDEKVLVEVNQNKGFFGRIWSKFVG